MQLCYLLANYLSPLTESSSVINKVEVEIYYSGVEFMKGEVISEVVAALMYAQ